MNFEYWNQKQTNLYQLYFENENGIKISELMLILQPLINNWNNLYQLLINNSDTFNKYSRINKIKTLKYNETNYLIIKSSLADYLIIDIDNNKVIEYRKNLEPFNKEFFNCYFNDKKIDESLYYYIDINEDSMEQIINMVNNNSIFLEDSNITYNLNKDNYITKIFIDITNGDVSLSFHNNVGGNFNCIFFNKDLIPIGVSNPTNNIVQLKEMCQSFKNIVIPDENIPEYVKTIRKI